MFWFAFLSRLSFLYGCFVKAIKTRAKSYEYGHDDGVAWYDDDDDIGLLVLLHDQITDVITLLYTISAIKVWENYANRWTFIRL